MQVTTMAEVAVVVVREVWPVRRSERRPERRPEQRPERRSERRSERQLGCI